LASSREGSDLPDKRERAGDNAAQSRAEMDQLSRRVKMLDERLDNLDSIVTTLVQRVMDKPLTIELTCPKCSQQIEINITSTTRLRGGF
jgi:RNAse (barnase) inhibitor barstar